MNQFDQNMSLLERTINSILSNPNATVMFSIGIGLAFGFRLAGRLFGNNEIRKEEKPSSESQEILKESLALIKEWRQMKEEYDELKQLIMKEQIEKEAYKKYRL